MTGSGQQAYRFRVARREGDVFEMRPGSSEEVQWRKGHVGWRPRCTKDRRLPGRNFVPEHTMLETVIRHDEGDLDQYLALVPNDVLRGLLHGLLGLSCGRRDGRVGWDDNVRTKMPACSSGRSHFRF